MPNLFQKLKQNFTDSKSSSSSSSSNVILATNKTITTGSASSSSSSQAVDEKNVKNFNLNNNINNNKVKHAASINKKENKGSIFSIGSNSNSKTIANDLNVEELSVDSNNSNNVNKEIRNISSKRSSINMPSKKSNNINNSNNNINQSVLSLIIDSSILKDQNNNNQNNDDKIFDPEPAQEETDTFERATFLDDRSFIVDDENYLDDDNEVAKINGLAKETKNVSCYTINEIPEGRLSKLNSSRASSRSSLGSSSGNTRTSSNFLEQGSDHVSSGLADMNEKKSAHSNNSADANSNNSDTGGGSKNVLLDALLKKFNVNMDLVEDAASNEEENNANNNGKIQKQTTKYAGDDQKRKQSQIQKKINRTQMEKQLATVTNESNNKSGNEKIAGDEYDRIDAQSSCDDNPREVKIIRSTGTQMSSSSGPTSNYKPTKTKQSFMSSSIKLPQNFECKYIGKAKCTGLWGIKNIREPVDLLVSKAKRHKSLNDLADVEALVSEKGIYIVHKPSSSIKPSTSFLKNKITTAPEKALKSGLLPISNISYAAQDNIYSKVFSCIVVQERDSKTTSECYSFLCPRNEIARKMALSITSAFKEYGKLLQLKESRITQTIQLRDLMSNEPDSFA